MSSYLPVVEQFLISWCHHRDLYEDNRLIFSSGKLKREFDFYYPNYKMSRKDFHSCLLLLSQRGFTVRDTVGDSYELCSKPPSWGGEHKFYFCH